MNNFLNEKNKIPASVCILCKNEADRLARCLDSVCDFAEVIVYDSGSTDGSQAICRQRGVRLVEGEWLGFASTRRKVFSLATQPWILWLDADEVVLPALRDEIHDVLKNAPARAAFEINRIVVFQGRRVRHGNWFPDRSVRLFRADAWEMPEQLVHEKLKISGSVSRLKALLEHYTYRDWADQHQRAEHYSTLWARQAFQNKKRCALPAAALRAWWRFFRGFVVRLGFLDGALGWKIAVANGREVWLKYRKLYDANKSV